MAHSCVSCMRVVNIMGLPPSSPCPRSLSSDGLVRQEPRYPRDHQKRVYAVEIKGGQHFRSFGPDRLVTVALSSSSVLSPVSFSAVCRLESRLDGHSTVYLFLSFRIRKYNPIWVGRRCQDPRSYKGDMERIQSHRYMLKKIVHFEKSNFLSLSMSLF